MADVKAAELNIAGMIAAIKKQIFEAETKVESGEEQGLFVLDEMELEIKFVIAKDEKMDAKFKVLVAEGGGDVTYKNEEVQSIRLRFKVAKKRDGGRGRMTEDNVDRGEHILRVDPK